MSDATDLAAHVQVRVAAQLLIELTNPRTPGASEIDTERLEAAAIDAIARFRTATGSSYDATNAVHADLAGDIALGLLMQRAGQADESRAQMAAVHAAIAQLAKRGGLVARTGSAIEPPANAQAQFDFTGRDWSGYRSDSVSREESESSDTSDD
ncbi:MAG: hypothetical protein AB7K09_15340 [Planctomycetota bacterium]